MPSVLFIQGAGPGVHDQWDNKLVESLGRELGAAYDIRYPRMPDEGDPAYAAWKSRLAQEIESLPNGSTLVGHSIGGAILVHALADDPPETVIGGIFLIATPFVGEGGWPSDEIAPRERLDVPSCPIFLYRGSNDETVPLDHVALYRKAIPGLTVRLLPGRDHQLDNDLAEVAEDIRRLASEVRRS